MGTHLSMKGHCSFAVSNCSIFLYGPPLTVLFVSSLPLDGSIEISCGYITANQPSLIAVSPFLVGGSPLFDGKMTSFLGFFRYPLVMKHGLLEDTLLINDFPIETPISGGFPSLPRLITRGKLWKIIIFAGDKSTINGHFQ